SDYTTSSEPAFEDAYHRFEQLLVSLQTPSLFRSAADAERFIDTTQNEISRLMLQGHFDFRASEEVSEPIVGADEVLREQSRRSSRELESLFGRVHVSRLTMFGGSGAAGIRPLDY